jgi:hypothetical protein
VLTLAEEAHKRLATALTLIDGQQSIQDLEGERGSALNTWDEMRDLEGQSADAPREA